MITATIPESWRVAEDGTVPLADVARTTLEYGCAYDVISAAARNGLVDVAKVGGRGGARHVTLENALLLVAVAALALTIGLAFGSTLRALKGAGARMTADGLTIPLATAA